MSIFAHPQETWTEDRCRKEASSAPADAFGNRPPKGLVSRSGAAYPGYGQSIRYNGGCVRDGEWYAGETVPLPIIPDTYEFVPLVSWGLRIQKKS